MGKFKTNRDKTDEVHNGRKCVMLAHGETGHAHAFYEPEKVELLESTDIKETKRLLNIKANGALLEHEEHTKHDFFTGQGEVRIQSEYSMEDVRRVVD